MANNLPETNNDSIDEKMEVYIINDTIFIDELNAPTDKKINKKTFSSKLNLILIPIYYRFDGFLNCI